MRIRRLLRTIRPYARRAFAAGVVALQLGVITSAVWEARTERRLDAHAEENGTRHLDQHREDTCGLCAVSTLASMPSAGTQGPVGRDAVDAATVRSQSAVSLTRRSTTFSRAPPAIA